MEKLIEELEGLLGYKIEYSVDEDKVVITSGENKPPEQEEFYEEFNNIPDAFDWLITTTMFLKQRRND